jgi:hypothetical protein
MAVAKLGAAVCGDCPAGGVIVKRVDDNVMNGVLVILSAKQRAFDDIFEFPNIPWPVMTSQTLHCGGREARKVAPAEFGAHSDAKMLGEFQQISLSISQWRKVDHIEAESIEKIPAKHATIR